MKKILVLLLAIPMFLGCDKINTGGEKNIDYNARRREIRQMIDTKGLSTSNFPFIDCSTSTSPLRDLVMYNILDIPYSWGPDIVTGSYYHIYWTLPKGITQGSSEHGKLAYELRELSRSSGSHGAYVNLIDGETDLIIDSRDISRNELGYADEKGVEVQTKPLAWDAMVFLVHPDNKVKSLTIEQIQDIYTGVITNWKEVGGADMEIHPYMRDPDSGSQEKMETMVMKGKKMLDWPEMVGLNMLSPYLSIIQDPKGIGYSPYFYCESMVRDLYNVRVIAIDGVKPSQEGIMRSVEGKSGGYPFYSQIYAAIRADEPARSIPHQIYDWFESESARSIIDESGYIPLK
ncbi:MAG: substrate-binding domain-containing protein [Bacteroidales bacterium]|nr:substrate-binding domain-containing protein [Bacteroidales bacterium]